MVQFNIKCPFSSTLCNTGCRAFCQERNSCLRMEHEDTQIKTMLNIYTEMCNVNTLLNEINTHIERLEFR